VKSYKTSDWKRRPNTFAVPITSELAKT
jgi:hypothetical protein